MTKYGVPHTHYQPHKLHERSLPIEDLQPGDQVRFLGIDTGKAFVVENNPDAQIIAIKIKGSTYWSGLGMTSYSSPEMMVLNYDGLCLLRWSLGRKTQKA